MCSDLLVSKIEANFVELKCEMMLSNKPSPSTPARSRNSPDSFTHSPIVCPSLTGAEENTSFASPPVPALQRKLLRLSMSARPTSGLRNEMRVEDHADESTVFGSDSIEHLEHGRSLRESLNSRSGLENVGDVIGGPFLFNTRIPHRPPSSDADTSLGEISMIEGIYDDATRAGEYLESLFTLGPAIYLSEPWPMEMSMAVTWKIATF